MRGKISQSTCDRDWASSEGAGDHSFLFLAYSGARCSLACGNLTPIWVSSLIQPSLPCPSYQYFPLDYRPLPLTKDNLVFRKGVSAADVVYSKYNKICWVWVIFWKATFNSLNQDVLSLGFCNSVFQYIFNWYRSPLSPSLSFSQPLLATFPWITSVSFPHTLK